MVGPDWMAMRKVKVRFASVFPSISGATPNRTHQNNHPIHRKLCGDYRASVSVVRFGADDVHHQFIIFDGVDHPVLITKPDGIKPL